MLQEAGAQAAEEKGRRLGAQSFVLQILANNHSYLNNANFILLLRVPKAGRGIHLKTPECEVC